MQNRARLPVLALLLALLARAAAAQSVAAPAPVYYSIGAGFELLQNATNNYTNTALNRNLTFDPGWIVSGAVGRRIGSHFRVELEVNHRGNDVRSVAPGTSPGGETDSTGFMANGFYDFGTGSIAPYIGAGVGPGIMRQTVGANGVQLARATNTVVAYQGIAGFSFPIIDKYVAGTIDYRYFGTTTPSFPDSNNVHYDSRYRSHSILVGIRVTM